MDYPYAVTIYIHLHPCVPHPPGFQIRESEKLECLGLSKARDPFSPGFVIYLFVFVAFNIHVEANNLILFWKHTDNLVNLGTVVY